MYQDEIKRLEQIVKQLQADDGCPWDKVQTHESIKAGCIEEACEVRGAEARAGRDACP